MNQALPKRAQFHHMKDGTQQDWEIIGAEFFEFRGDVCKRIKTHLMLLEGDCGGFAVDRLTHSLQTATLAHNDGKDDEYVVCALLHDIGDTLGPANHADVAAVLLEPYVSEANHWMVKHHGIFQGYYFFHFMGLDRDLRDQYKDHPHFERTLEFIEKYDAPAFDPDGECYELSFFEPMMGRVFKEPKRSLYISDSA
jgi:predicted HD phosphohydrolase